MAWFAKPYGAYGYNSIEGIANINEMYAFFNGRDYTLETICGVIGNSIAEGGLNPWRWQSDTVNLSAGYGLFQYTPASGYIDGCSDLAGYAPNFSVTETTEGANPSDGLAQCIAFAENTLGKWVSTCWRPYWDIDTYYDLYYTRQRILDTYGDGERITMEQFKGITSVYDATFVFLACFEGPAVPSMGTRFEYASAVYEAITGDTPDVPPTPTPPKRKGLTIYMMLRPF